jgi:hypothetical protein
MQELRFVAVSEDGSYAVLAVPGRSARFTLPIDERLRAVALGQTSRLAQYEIEVESPLRPKEIQARIRAGETAEEIADAAGIPLERVRWFEGPVLAERAYIADQAQAASVRRPGDSSGPGPRLRDIVPSRMKAAGAVPDEGQWDSRKRGDGNWQVTLTFTSGGRLHVAEWMFDPRRRHVLPEDDNAARLSLSDADLPPLSVPVPGEATVTPLAPRLGAVSAGGGGRLAPDRPASAPAALSRPGSHRDPQPERSPAASATTSDHPERTRPTPQRPLVFEEPYPLDVQPELEPPPAAARPARDSATARPAREPAAAERPGRPAASHELRTSQPPREAATAQPAREPATAERPGGPAGQPAREPATARRAREAATAERPGGPAGQPSREAATVQPAREPAGAWPEREAQAEPQPAARPAAAAAAPEPGAVANAEPAAAEQATPASPRPGKKNPRGRRSSVPSWDEVMLGSSRQRE